ncbi:restriction endonuclease [Paramaledivibacter caminithermalis]|jgi:restriction system protein|uniref:Restriction system protein n=1 Tax=Paramaledivibacter caminithermalis (strain DSM 15212 / CIP 107654 / DViRD3) TaxID=1121301 RepID=A0A1M6NBQ5_PARC5|nr:restriction endonuclease [Paramaledivibacter caminithermalis]SHJ92976.1 restriction system protein [Paramaledivibacter caminithermalis DSM 15212]
MIISELNNNDYDRILNDFYSSFENGYVFERFLKHFFEELGLDEIEITQRSGDNGIDLKAKRKGFDEDNGLDTINYYIQAKRYSPTSTLPPRFARELRGTLPSGYKGILITTGRFSRRTLEMANEDESRPIIFISGKKLIQMCIDNGIGFTYKPVFNNSMIQQLINESGNIESNTNNIEDAVFKRITVNDARARILSIPSTIYEMIDENANTFEVIINGEARQLRINRNRKYFGGITDIYRDLGIILDGSFNESESYWVYDSDLHRLIVTIYQVN